MRFLSVLILCAVAVVGFLFWTNYPEVKSWCKEKIFLSKLQTLEVRYTAESIMESHKKELLRDQKHSFLEPVLKYHPYLFMKVKYNRSREKTAEGVILWSLVDGEMVLDTKTWEETHGFTDCIDSCADRGDFRVINALAKGAMKREEIAKKLNVESDVLNAWLERCKAKNLVVQNGEFYRLHLESPKILVTPETRLVSWLVTQTSYITNRIAKKYRPSQVISVTKAAFGNDFTIREVLEVFLPVYNITVQNPDGSLLTTYWNALNGKQFPQTSPMD